MPHILRFVVIVTQILTAPSCETISGHLRNSSVLESGNIYFNPQTFNAFSRTCTEKKPIKRQCPGKR